MIEIEKIQKYSTLLAPILLIVLLGFNLVFLINVSKKVQNEIKDIEKKNVELSVQLERFEGIIEEDNYSIVLKQDEDTIEFLKSEYENFQTFANSDRESFFNLINLFFVALGVLVTGATIVLYWLFGQSREEVRKSAESVIQVSADEVATEAKTKFDTMLGPTITEFEGKYSELNRMLDSGQKLRNSKFLVSCPEEEKFTVETKLIDRLRAISNTQLMDFNEFEDIKTKLENKEIDMLIYVYIKEHEKNNETFKKYIQHLIDTNSKIPFIVYIEYDQGRIEGEENNLFNLYPYSAFANVPVTLTTTIISMSNLLSYEGGNENDC